ncbi:MAG: GspE/PulE family protein [Rhodothermales bacterium]|nr:GspE/PulE family protein [Rhodothermales bacterium]
MPLSIAVLPTPAPALLALLPAVLAHRHRVVPLALSGRELEVGVEALPEPAVARRLALVTGRRIRPVPLPAEDLAELLSAWYPEGRRQEVLSAPREAGPVGSAIQHVEVIVQRAQERRASDIHLEPAEEGLRVRYRIDGALRVDRVLPARMQDEVVSRIKILAGLDIAERRRPQDGRFRFLSPAGEVDIRVATLPSSRGEKAVLRLLDRGGSGGGLPFDLAALGLAGRDHTKLREALARPYGMILSTGPTGSGKTTTLYAALQALNAPDINIVTIEDPVEYELPGVCQTHVRPDIGYSFAHALRAMLRQDPDVIFVGEIRDAETAELAVRAALTGHLVLSTLHTNDAAGAAVRLVDLGVPPFLVGSALRLVIAQRLLRRICPACRIRAHPHATDAGWRGAGCPACHDIGYRGRIAVMETMPVSEPIANLIVRRADTAAIRKQARAEGMRTLRDAAHDAMNAGIVAAEEVYAET